MIKLIDFFGPSMNHTHRLRRIDYTLSDDLVKPVCKPGIHRGKETSSA